VQPFSSFKLTDTHAGFKFRLTTPAIANFDASLNVCDVRIDAKMSAQLDLTTLRLFLTIAEGGSIAHTASRENLTASSVSKRISDMEAALDVQLLERHRSGVRLTPAGHALAERAMGIRDLTDRIASEMSTYARGVKGHVRVAANPSSITQFLPAILSRFVKAFPDIRVELVEQTSERTVQMIADKAVDVGIVAGSVDFRGLASRDFRRDTLALLVHRSHPLARRRSIGYVDTLEYDQVGLAEGSSIQATLLESAAKAGRSIRLKVRVASFDALRGLVEANIGIACLPIGCIKPYVRTHNLVAVQLTDAWAHRQLKVCAREFQKSRPATRHFLSALGW
jgi:DNA-binding transcriptional LysR family regulator